MAPTKGNIDQGEVLELISGWRQSYEEGDPRFFDYFAEDASLFPISSATRIDGVEEYRRGFEPQLTAGIKRRAQIMSPEIKVIGDAAVVSAHLRVYTEGVTTNTRASFVVERDERGALKVAHLHISPAAAPRLPAAQAIAARTLDEVTLLEERVATAAAAVGTPK